MNKKRLVEVLWGESMSDDEFGKLVQSIKEAGVLRRFDNWVRPSQSQLEQEYHVEQELKGHRFFSDLDEFLEQVERAEVVEVTPEMDRRIGYRSNTQSQEELLNLIRRYRSYPEFRNEDTLQNLYDRFRANETMDMPLVLKFPDGRYRVFAGNTRMDVAFQLGINPHVLLIEVPS